MNGMIEEQILRALRNQAWERAKGEMRAVAATFYSGDDASAPGQYDQFVLEMNKFIDQVEGYGLAD